MGSSTGSASQPDKIGESVANRADLSLLKTWVAPRRPSVRTSSSRPSNVSDRSIDYVRLHFAFEDRNGKVLDGESLYNHHAESLSDDAYVQKVLNEKPHFDPIRPGQSDTFRFSIPCSELPMFSKVEMFSDDIKR
jgi:hypothetical protein